MKDEKKKLSGKKLAVRIAVLSIVALIIVGCSMIFAREMRLKNMHENEIADLSSKMASEIADISKYTGVVNEKGDDYIDYIESEAQGLGYGKPGETVNYNEAYGN